MTAVNSLLKQFQAEENSFFILLYFDPILEYMFHGIRGDRFLRCQYRNKTLLGFYIKTYWQKRLSHLKLSRLSREELKLYIFIWRKWRKI